MRKVHEAPDGYRVIELRQQPTTHLIGDHITLTIYESHQPGRWVLVCDTARIDHREFDAKPHDVDDALRMAIIVVSERLFWLMKQWERELKLMRKAIEKETNEA